MPRQPSSSSKACRFRHISYRSSSQQSGYVVQYSGKTWGGFHLDVKTACDTLRKAIKETTGRNVRELPLKPGLAQTKKRSSRKYWGISFHKGRQRWVGNKVPLGATFGSAEEAHQALSKVLKRPAKSLPKPCHLNTSYPAEE